MRNQGTQEEDSFDFYDGVSIRASTVTAGIGNYNQNKNAQPTKGPRNVGVGGGDVTSP